MVAALAEAYHWPLDSIKKLTMPQIIMLTHAAKVNHDRWDRNREDSTSKTSRPRVKDNFKGSKKEDPVVNKKGERLSSLAKDFDRLVKYLAPLTNVEAMDKLTD